MKHISTSSLRQLLVAVLCAFGLTASAQYTVTTSQRPTTDYSNTGQQFNLTNICAALGTDTATFAAQYPEGDITFQAYDADGNLTSAYTGNTGEFWLNKAGAVQAYSGAYWFIGANFDIENDQLYVYTGQMPSAFSTADTVTTKAQLAYGDKSVTFDITLYITEPLKNNSDGKLSNIQIVGSAEATHHQFPRTSYASDEVSIEVKDIASLLGIEAADLVDNMSSVMFAPTTDEYSIISDSLTNTSSATPTPAFWYAKTVDRSTGQWTNTLADHAYSDSCRIYIAGFALNATCDTITAQLGQYPGNVSANETYSATAYVVWGQKAYKLTYNLVVDQPDITSIDDMTMVGERTDTIKGLYASSSQYVLVPVTYPVDEIAELLGCSTSELALQALQDETSFATGSTANNGGYWMNSAGYVTTWGSTAIWYCEPASQTDATHVDISSMNVGLYPGNSQEGDTIRGSLYVVNPDGTKYYKLNIIGEVGAQQSISGLDIVKTLSASMQLVTSTQDHISEDPTSSGVSNQTPYYVTPEQASELIGTSSPTFYVLYADSTWKADGTHKYNKDDYKCTGTGTGFWLGQEGYAANWGSTSPVGLMYAPTLNGLFYCFQYPGSCTVGNTFKTTAYLVNEETQQAIEIKFNIVFVDALEDVSEVGTVDLGVALDMSDTETEFPIDDIAAALGADVETLLTSVKGKQADGTYSQATDAVGNGLMFNNDGSCNNDGGNLGFTLSEDGKTITTFANSTDDLGATYTIEATVAFDVTADDGSVKRCVVNLTFMDPATYANYAAGINGVKAETAKSARIYNLNGQQVGKPAHGIYIQNGKKFVVK